MRWHLQALSLPATADLDTLDEACRTADTQLRGRQEKLGRNLLALRLTGGQPAGERDPLAAPLLEHAVHLDARLRHVPPSMRRALVADLPAGLLPKLVQARELERDRELEPAR